MTALTPHISGGKMSNRGKSNLAVISSFITVFLAIGGLIWAMSARANDLLHIAQVQSDHESRIRTVEQEATRTARIEEKVDALKADLQRIERKLP